MKKYLTLCAVIAVLFALITFGAPALHAEETITHTVEKGDTLWGIANKYLKDSDKWKNLWKNNPDIKNPHLIHPGDIVKITPDGITVERGGEVVAEIPAPAEEPPAEEPPAPVKQVDLKKSPFTGEITESPAYDAGHVITLSKVVSDSIARTGLISDEEQELVGRILSSTDGTEANLYVGKNVFLSMKDPKNVEVGDTYSVYKKGKKIKNPKTKKPAGFSIEFLGAVEVTSVDGDVIEGKITTSYREMNPGESLMNYIPPAKYVTVVPSKVLVEAHIVGAYEGTIELSKDTVVYIDKGFNDGLEDGNMLVAYKDRAPAKDAMTGKKIQLPSIKAGRLIIVKAHHKSATAIIIDSTQPLNAGDLVKNALPEKEE